LPTALKFVNSRPFSVGLDAGGILSFCRLWQPAFQRCLAANVHPIWWWCCWDTCYEMTRRLKDRTGNDT